MATKVYGYLATVIIGALLGIFFYQGCTEPVTKTVTVTIPGETKYVETPGTVVTGDMKTRWETKFKYQTKVKYIDSVRYVPDSMYKAYIDSIQKKFGKLYATFDTMFTDSATLSIIFEFLNDSTGKSMFYVAYNRPDKDSTLSITFTGDPESASFWDWVSSVVSTPTLGWGALWEFQSEFGSIYPLSVSTQLFEYLNVSLGWKFDFAKEDFFNSIKSKGPEVGVSGSF